MANVLVPSVLPRGHSTLSCDAWDATIPEVQAALLGMAEVRRRFFPRFLSQRLLHMSSCRSASHVHS